MEKEFLEKCLAEGLSLEKIGERVGKHPSTVAYWLKKHGLEPTGAKYAPRGGLERNEIEPLVAEGLTLAEMAKRLDRSISSVRYWLLRHGFNADGGRRLASLRAHRAAGTRRLVKKCRRHGLSEFALEGRGYYRCTKCRSEAVAERRRVVKQIVADEVGGRCMICGYDRCLSALHFHHLDPEEKQFGLAQNGVSRSLERSRKEAEKCVLLCANCHAEVEGGVTPPPEPV
jgi:transposase